jgi:hypothetical protein
MTLPVHVTITGLREAQGRFARGESVHYEKRKITMKNFGPTFVGLLKSNAPIKTGKFSNSFHWKLFGAEEHEASIKFYSKDPKAPFIIQATREHEIAARGGGVLRFWVSGKKIFAKRVKHPGTKPSNFIDKAIDKGGKEYLRYMQRVSIETAFFLNGNERR